MVETLREEVMNDFFTKNYIEGFEEWGIVGSFNRFSKADEGEEFHDHNFDFDTIILVGGYIQERVVFYGEKLVVVTETLIPGKTYRIKSTDIHRIVRLPDDRALTLMIRRSEDNNRNGFFRLGDNGLEHRFWNKTEWRAYVR